MSSPAADGFAARVAAVVAAIPPGSVATYGEVAVEAGYAAGASRAVGNVLQQVDGLPWWRVVTASGRLVPGLEARHARLLAAEGVDVSGGRVRMARRRTRSPTTGSPTTGSPTTGSPTTRSPTTGSPTTVGGEDR